ncbi:MAG: hypothetical protein V4732_17460 [Pseudomonadota bacterium]
METKYTALVKNLLQEYYKRNISVEDYRLERNKIIYEMDIELNGTKNIQQEAPNQETIN